MINKLIGIISYLPDDLEIRKNRLFKLKTLLATCNDLFKLPILIVSQNWTSDEIESITNNYNVMIESFPKLGITGARKKLRELFINSSYQYLIMLDDDSVISGNSLGVQHYFEDIEEHPSGYGLFHKSLLKLFAISKDLYSSIPFVDINPENEEGFEDRIWVHNVLEKQYPNKKFQFRDLTNLDEKSPVTGDINSTWYSKNIDLKKMNEITQKIIGE